MGAHGRELGTRLATARAACRKKRWPVEQTLSMANGVIEAYELDEQTPTRPKLQQLIELYDIQEHEQDELRTLRELAHAERLGVHIPTAVTNGFISGTTSVVVEVVAQFLEDCELTLPPKERKVLSRRIRDGLRELFK
jgi:hypothetical protein